MKLLLYVDEYCYRYNGQYYFENFSRTLIYRYLSAFEILKIPVRVKEVSKIEDLGVFNKVVNDERIEIVPLPFVQGPKEFLKHYFSYMKAIKHITFGCQFAILRHPSLYSFTIQKKVWKKKLPYAVEIVYDCYDGYMIADTIISRYANLYMHKMQQRACKKADGVSCVTREYLQNRYYAKKKDAISTYYSSIEMPESFYYQPRKYPADKKFRIVHIAYQISYNGRKGHNQLLEALKILKDKGYDVEVFFIGGDYRDGISLLTQYAKQLGVDRLIHFCGFLSRPELRELLTKVNMSVLPTKAEGLPRVVIEAMAMGLPCISSNVSGNPELLDSRFLLDYQDVEGYARCIEEMIINPDLYEQASYINFERSKEYSAPVLNKRRTDFYRALKAKVK